MVYNTKNVRAKAAKDAKPPAKKAAPKKRAAVKKTAITRIKAAAKSTAKKAAPRKKPLAGKNQHGGARANSGGARKGSGRPKGAATKKTRQIADDLAASGEITPLEFLLQVMRTTPEDLQAKHKKGDLDTEMYLVALADLQRRRESAASQACPFMHPRLSSIEASVGLSGHDAFVALLDSD
jgi:hypothetical protein